MTVLVTGGAGYIGSHMVLALLDAGEQVVVVDDLSTGFREAVPAGVPLYVGSSGDTKLIAGVLRVHDIDAVIHFAAALIVPESIREPLRYYLNNTVNSRALIETAIKGGVRHFIFSSTAAVYGNPERNPVTENSAARPVSPYGTSKLMTEMMLGDAAVAHGLQYAVLRYFNVAGADPAMRAGQSTAEATHLIKVAVQAALGTRGSLLVFGSDYATPDGTCIRDYIHVQDLVSAHLRALIYLRGGGANITMNCGYGRGYSVLDVIESVKRVSGTDFPVVQAPRRAGDPAIIVADAQRIRSTLGWIPELDDLDTIVSHALLWERSLLDRADASAARLSR
jgi:UDP-glucose 4-epimerase